MVIGDNRTVQVSQQTGGASTVVVPASEVPLGTVVLPSIQVILTISRHAVTDLVD